MMNSKFLSSKNIANYMKYTNELYISIAITISMSDLWCMTVHSCFVEDGSGTQFVILNEDG